jgi:tRNA-2-methylthio-N6-dimethylallyladenosine synthase
VREVLIEGDSKRSDQFFRGRTSQNKVVVFPKTTDQNPGDYVMVEIEDATSATLIGKFIGIGENKDGI